MTVKRIDIQWEALDEGTITRYANRLGLVQRTVIDETAKDVEKMLGFNADVKQFHAAVFR